MQRRENFIPFFLVFFLLSLFLIILGRSGLLTGVSSIFNKAVSPAKSATLGIFSFLSPGEKAIKELSQENARLRKELSEKQNLVAENKALKNQFESSGSQSQSLLPAKVVGSPGFIPGVSLPEHLIIDKGQNQNVRKGDAIIVGNYLVGKVVEASVDFSKVELVINKNSSFTAKISPSDGAEIPGIIKGKGNDELIFENVLLTASIKKDDMVLTRGEQNEKGEGYPPEIIVGKIVSVEKKSSDLFQKAALQSFVNFSTLTTVFVLR